MDGAHVRVVWGSLKENVMPEQRADKARKHGKRGGLGGTVRARKQPGQCPKEEQPPKVLELREQGLSLRDRDGGPGRPRFCQTGSQTWSCVRIPWSICQNRARGLASRNCDAGGLG